MRASADIINSRHSSEICRVGLIEINSGDNRSWQKKSLSGQIWARAYPQKHKINYKSIFLQDRSLFDCEALAELPIELLTLKINKINFYICALGRNAHEYLKEEDVDYQPAWQLPPLELKNKTKQKTISSCIISSCRGLFHISCHLLL